MGAPARDQLAAVDLVADVLPELRQAAREFSDDRVVEWLLEFAETRRKGRKDHWVQAIASLITESAKNDPALAKAIVRVILAKAESDPIMRARLDLYLEARAIRHTSLARSLRELQETGSLLSLGEPFYDGVRQAVGPEGRYLLVPIAGFLEMKGLSPDERKRILKRIGKLLALFGIIVPSALAEAAAGAAKKSAIATPVGGLLAKAPILLGSAITGAAAFIVMAILALLRADCGRPPEELATEAMTTGHRRSPATDDSGRRDSNLELAQLPCDRMPKSFHRKLCVIEEAGKLTSKPDLARPLYHRALDREAFIEDVNQVELISVPPTSLIATAVSEGKVRAGFGCINNVLDWMAMHELLVMDARRSPRAAAAMWSKLDASMRLSAHCLPRAGVPPSSLHCAVTYRLARLSGSPLPSPPPECYRNGPAYSLEAFERARLEEQLSKTVDAFYDYAEAFLVYPRQQTLNQVSFYEAMYANPMVVSRAEWEAAERAKLIELRGRLERTHLAVVSNDLVIWSVIKEARPGTLEPVHDRCGVTVVGPTTTRVSKLRVDDQNKDCDNHQHCEMACVRDVSDGEWQLHFEVTTSTLDNGMNTKKVEAEFCKRAKDVAAAVGPCEHN